MKKLLPILFCIFFAWSGLAIWNWAESLAEITDTNAQLFDAIAALLIVAALSCSCWYHDIKKYEKSKHKKCR